MKAKERWIVRWCGGLCTGNPHRSEAAARKWIADAYAEAKKYKQPIYGDYSVTLEPEVPRTGREQGAA